MKEINIKKDTKIHCLKSKTFPDGIAETHKKLHQKIPFHKGRNYYGISYMNSKGEIIYKAAIEEDRPGELQHLNLDTFLIKSGKYASITFENFVENIPKIKEAFNTLKNNPNIDPQGVALEWYPTARIAGV